METLIVGSGILGVILGRFWRWMVLIPVLGFSVVLLLANPVHLESSPFVQFAAVAVSLQAGYAMGLVTRGFRFGAKRSKTLGAHTAGEALPNNSEIRGSGRRAA